MINVNWLYCLFSSWGSILMEMHLHEAIPKCHFHDHEGILWVIIISLVE